MCISKKKKHCLKKGNRFHFLKFLFNMSTIKKIIAICEGKKFYFNMSKWNFGTQMGISIWASVKKMCYVLFLFLFFYLYMSFNNNKTFWKQKRWGEPMWRTKWGRIIFVFVFATSKLKTIICVNGWGRKVEDKGEQNYLLFFWVYYHM